MAQAAISISNLHVAYGRQAVLQGVDLEVSTGSIFGFLGRNGAGKTTTIQTLLGLLKPQQGRCRVAGLDPQIDPVAVRQAVGYMAEDQQMYGWMRIEQIIQWCSHFYPTWDRVYCETLRQQFDLSAEAKIKTLSKGQNTRLALLLALAHRPQIVILDDPTLGLDPIARKEFLRHVITLLQAEGVTVFFSSHLLYEIEPVADHIAILDRGHIVKSGPTDHLRDTTHRFVFKPQPRADLSQLPGVLDVVQRDGQVQVVLEDIQDETRSVIRSMAASEVQECGLNLDEIFEAHVIGNRGREAVTC